MKDDGTEQINGVWVDSRTARWVRELRKLEDATTALAQLDNGSNPEWQRVLGERVTSVTRDLVPLWPLLTGLITLSGLITYLILRLAYSTFYAPLGVQPEDVGFGYSQIIGQSATALIVFVLASLIPVSLGYWITSTAIREFSWKRSQLVLTANGILTTIGGLLAAAQTSYKLPGAVVVVVNLLVTYVNTGAFVRLAQLGVERRAILRRIPVRPATEKSFHQLERTMRAMQRILLSLIAYSLLGAFATPFSVLHNQAAQDSAAVRRGESRNGPVVVGVPVAAWGGEVASVYERNPSGTETRMLSSSCLMYLGQDKGEASFYDVTHKDRIWIATTSTIVVVHHEQSHC